MQNLEQHGAVLELVPHWLRMAYWFVVFVVVAAVSYAAAAHIGDYAEGPAVVRFDGRVDLAIAAGGVVTQVDVAAGSRVVPGQVLVRLYSGTEQQEFERINREFELKLARILLYPSEQATRESLSTLRAERELADARIRARTLIAPHAGVVTNLRARVGQSFANGEVVLTLVDESKPGTYSVVALVPGQFRPMLRTGLSMRLRLDGYPNTYTEVPVESVGNEAVGPNEVRRHLGQELGDAIKMQGSLVLLRGRLPASTFDFDGKTYRYYDGVPGQVGVRVRSLRLLVMLLPSLRELVQP